jgi:phosphoribosylformylglycinamidine cyclo-ligase
MESTSTPVPPDRQPAREGMTYAKAGVEIDAKYAAVKGAIPAIEATRTPAVLGGVGGFGSLFHLAAAGTFRDPVLVGSTDGVGTKVNVAIEAGIHDTVGQCLVNHCVNDILVMGARPLFFLDYVAVGKMDPAMVTSIIRGVAKACQANGCALVGGETAEMRGLYKVGDYDLAGFIVGVVEKDRILDGSRIAPGDKVLGLRSSGLHTNGYTLARKICFDMLGLRLDSRPPELGGVNLRDALLAIHRPYLRVLAPLLDAGLVTGLSHITGGGFLDNLPRVLPAGTAVELSRRSWEPPPLFRFLVEKGNVPVDDAYRTFNMGIGMVVIVEAARAKEATARLQEAGEDVVDLGRVVRGNREVVWT